MARKPTNRPRACPTLSRLELEVMNIVWDLGDCTSAQVIEAFRKTRTLAPTTVRTVLAKLREKGYVKPIPSIERGFTFRATVRREAVARRSLKDLVESLFHDSPQQAIAYLLDEAEITDAELDELRRMIADRKMKGH